MFRHGRLLVFLALRFDVISGESITALTPLALSRNINGIEASLLPGAIITGLDRYLAADR